MNFETGILDKSRLVANILMLALVVGNIFFSIQYTTNLKQQGVQDEQLAQESAKDQKRFQVARFLKLFIDTVLNTDKTVSFDERVKLESDLRQLADPDLTKLWDAFVASKTGTVAEENAVKLMKMLANKMI